MTIRVSSDKKKRWSSWPKDEVIKISHLLRPQKSNFRTSKEYTSTIPYCKSENIYLYNDMSIILKDTSSLSTRYLMWYIVFLSIILKIIIQLILIDIIYSEKLLRIKMINIILIFLVDINITPQISLPKVLDRFSFSKFSC